MSKRLLIILPLVLLVLAAAIFIQLFGKYEQRKDMIPPDLGTLIPAELPGWTIQDRPIAETESLQRSVNALLNFDAGIFRTYKKGPLEISIYIAYWLPAKVPESVVDTHTPDICWTLNGWQMTKLPPLPPLTINNQEISLNNHRLFTHTGTNLTLLYWHLSGNNINESKSYMIYSRSPIMDSVKWRLRQIFAVSFRPPQQQLFVRISSNLPIANQLEAEPIAATLKLISRVLDGDNFYTKMN